MHLTRYTLALLPILAACRAGTVPDSAPTPGPVPAAAPNVIPATCDIPTNACPPAPAYPADVVGWVKQSSPFRGTVTALDVTSPDFNNTDPTRQVYITVENAWPAGSFLATFIGIDDTVLMVMKDVPSFAVGYEGYFFGIEQSVGKVVTLAEVAHVAPSAYPALDTQIPAIQQTLIDDALGDRMTGSVAVVEGHVTATKVLPGVTGSEHDPVWAEATVEVACALRGTLTTGSIAVRFASSTDVAWYESPKLAVGDDAIYLLRDDTVTGASSPGYVVTEPSDRQTTASAQHLADLLTCPPPAL